MLTDEYSILARIDAVCEDIERQDAAAVQRSSLSGEAPVPLFASHDCELDEQRRIANEEWQEVQEDRYRLFQRTIDPVWSVDVRFAGRVSADSGANSAPPELGKAGPATFHPKTKNRSAVSALLDANEAIKLISSITPATAKRLAEEIASDPTMDENVRLSLAHRLTTQAKALSERPTTTMSSTSLHPAAFSASALSTMPNVKLVGGGGGNSDSRPQQHAFNPTASTGLFGNQQQALTSTALFPVQPAAEPDQMLLFAPDRNFDSAVATSMKRLSGIVQSTKARPIPTAHPDRERQQELLRRQTTKAHAMRELKNLASGAVSSNPSSQPVSRTGSRLFGSNTTTLLPRARSHASSSAAFDEQWAQSLHPPNAAASGASHSASGVSLTGRTSFGGGGVGTAFSSKPQHRRSATEPKLATHARRTGSTVSFQPQHEGGQSSTPQDAYGDEEDDDGGMMALEDLERSPSRHEQQPFDEDDYYSQQEFGGNGDFDDGQPPLSVSSSHSLIHDPSHHNPHSASNGSLTGQRYRAQQALRQHQQQQMQQQHAQERLQQRQRRAATGNAAAERLYRQAAVKTREREDMMRKAEEDRLAKEAAEQRAKPQISEYAKSLPRLSDEVRFSRINRPTVDKHLLQTYAQATEADAFSFAPSVCPKSAKMVEKMVESRLGSIPAHERLFLDSFRGLQ